MDVSVIADEDCVKMSEVRRRPTLPSLHGSSGPDLSEWQSARKGGRMKGGKTRKDEGRGIRDENGVFGHPFRPSSFRLHPVLLSSAVPVTWTRPQAHPP